MAAGRASLRTFLRRKTREQSEPEIDLIPGVPESSLGSCYGCGRSWKRVHGHSTPYTEGRSCFPLCEECWAKWTPGERLPFYSMLVAEWRRQMGPIGEEDWPLIRQAVMEGK